MPILPKAEYCPICEYPIRNNKCLNCEEKAKYEKEQAAKERRNLIRALGGQRAVDDFNEEKFNINDKNRLAFEICKNFDPKPPKNENLYIYGQTGRGKSHLAIMAARKYFGYMKPMNDLYSGRECVVACVKPVDIYREIRGADDANEETRIITYYINQPVLVIDDLGIGRDSEFAVTTIYEIIDGRYMNESGGLIITTNLDPGELSVKMGDDRVSSRLAQMCRIINLNGPDYRVGKP